jgi:hypothetical protein
MVGLEMNSSERYQEHFRSWGIHFKQICVQSVYIEPFHSLISLVVLTLLATCHKDHSAELDY